MMDHGNFNCTERMRISFESLRVKDR